MNLTLILGAGVNKEINPEIGLGADLIKDISDRVTDRTSIEKPYLSDLLDKNLGISYSNRWSFVDHLDKYRNGLSNSSIDEFLNEVKTFPEFKEYRDEFMIIGRTSIIFHIVGYEGSSTVKNIEQDIRDKKTWFSVLGDFIEKNNILEENSQINLNLITFNYDRILEGFLLKKFDTHCIEFVNTKIHHVYGRIGCLPNLKKRPIPNSQDMEQCIPLNYGNDKIMDIQGLSNHIQLIYEERNDTSGIQNIIEKSDKILVMGYGFDSLNNKRLGLHNLDSINRDRIKVGKAPVNFGVAIYPGSGSDFSYRRFLAGKVRNLFHEANFHYQPCYNFLRDYLLASENCSKEF